MIGVRRPLGFLAGVVPFLLALAIIVVSTLPLGAGDLWATLGPQLVLGLVFHWSLRPSRALPPVLVFVLGLAVDLLSGGPLGFWGLIYLTACALTFAVRERPLVQRRIGSWIGFAVVAALASVMAWAVGSAFYAAVVPPAPLVAGWVAAVCLYVPLSPVFDLLSGPSRRTGG